MFQLFGFVLHCFCSPLFHVWEDPLQTFLVWNVVDVSRLKPGTGCHPGIHPSFHGFLVCWQPCISLVHCTDAWAPVTGRTEPRSQNRIFRAAHTFIATRSPPGHAVFGHEGSHGSWWLRTLQNWAAWDKMPVRASPHTAKSVSSSRQNVLLLYTNIKPNFILFESTYLHGN